MDATFIAQEIFVMLRPMLDEDAVDDFALTDIADDAADALVEAFAA